MVGNALKYTPDGGRISISIQPSSAAVGVSVADTGPGISEEVLPHIFDRFYQVTDQQSGNGHAGLGLAIARRIVELHGSELDVRSRPGEGTTFAFGLPVWNAP